MSDTTAKPVAVETALQKKWRYFAAGVLIPVFSTLAFNVLDAILRGKSPGQFEPKDINVSIGCAFAIFSMAAVSKNKDNTQHFMIIAILLLVFAIVGSGVTIGWLKTHFSEWVFFILADLFAAAATAWAVNKTADEE
jgi:hypothetical protein